MSWSEGKKDLMNTKTEKNRNKYENPLKIAVSKGFSMPEGINEPKFEK